MTLKKTVRIKSVGAPATIHRIDNVSSDLNGKTTTVSVSCFYDEDALAKALSPLATTSIFVDGVPEGGVTLKEFAEAKLSEPAPEGTPVDQDVIQYGANRYVFAGAKIVA